MIKKITDRVKTKNKKQAYKMKLDNFVNFEGGIYSALITKFIGDYDNESRIKFHIKSGDYFGTLATILDLVCQERKKVDRKHTKVLKKIKDDLVYLQNNYRIVKRK